jgi:putative transposase
MPVPYRQYNGIIWINYMAVGNGFKPFPTGKPNHGLPEIIRGLKTFSSCRINKLNDKNNFQWQKSYYNQIIRSELSLKKIREYILDNAVRWELDHDRNEQRDITQIVGNVSVGNGFKLFPTRNMRVIAGEE